MKFSFHFELLLASKLIEFKTFLLECEIFGFHYESKDSKYKNRYYLNKTYRYTLALYACLQPYNWQAVLWRDELGSLYPRQRKFFLLFCGSGDRGILQTSVVGLMDKKEIS